MQRELKGWSPPEGEHICGYTPGHVVTMVRGGKYRVYCQPTNTLFGQYGTPTTAFLAAEQAQTERLRRFAEDRAQVLKRLKEAAGITSGPANS